MSDMIDLFRERKAHLKELRAKYGENCPRCLQRRPKANPTILLPGDRCRSDGYVDPRPELTTEQMS